MPTPNFFIFEQMLGGERISSRSYLHKAVLLLATRIKRMNCTCILAPSLDNIHNEKANSTLDSLNITSHDLHDLDAPFSEEELKTAVMQTPKERGPGRDGYTGLFYKICWDIIKVDLLAALQQVYQLRGQWWQLLNSANVTLLPKKEEPTSASDYRTINLMHSLAKLLSKILANRLAPHLSALVSPCQSAFIKG
jgi:hypothetical protein